MSWKAHESALRYLLRNLSKEMLIKQIIALINGICSTEEEKMKLTRQLATYIQAYRVVLDEVNLDEFEESFRAEVEEAMKDLHKKL